MNFWSGWKGGFWNLIENPESKWHETPHNLKVVQPRRWWSSGESPQKKKNLVLFFVFCKYIVIYTCIYICWTIQWFWYRLKEDNTAAKITLHQPKPRLSEENRFAIGTLNHGLNKPCHLPPLCWFFSLFLFVL